MTDDEIISSAEKIRLEELKLANLREQRQHEKWKTRHESVNKFLHSDIFVAFGVFVLLIILVSMIMILFVFLS